MLVKHILNKGLFSKNAGVLCRAAYHQHGHHEPSTMNDLPVPAGDWKEQHTRQNTKYNAILAVGVLAFVGTIAFVKSSEIIHFNYSPPKSLD